MRIPSEIMSIVRRKETDKKNLNRCLNMLVCPQCGTDLTRKDISPGEEDLIIIKYTCKCNFTITRPNL